MAGVVGLLAQPAPTGALVVDIVLVVVSTTIACAAAGRAPWWLLAILAVISAALAGDPLMLLGVAFALAAFTTALLCASTRFDHPLMRSTSAGLAINAMLWSDAEVFFGFSAIVATVAVSAVAIAGVVARPAPLRRRCTLAAGAVVCATLIAVVCAGLAANSVRHDMSNGTAAAKRAVRELANGDYAAAAASFERAADAFETSADQVEGPLTAGGRLIPGVAQNLKAGREVTRAVANTADDAAVALRLIDPDELTLDAGAVDLGELRAAREQLLIIRDSIDDLSSTVEGVASPWLVDGLRERIVDLHIEVDDNAPKVDGAVAALTLAPPMLGGDEPRHYLILFTTPAEARGLGGFSGNYAEIVVDKGAVRVAEFGRSGDLNDRLSAAGAQCRDCPREFLDAYGTYGFNSGPGGRVGPLVWLNITMSPNFPAVAETAANLYHEAGGSRIDGVAVLDPYVIAELMHYTGPIEVPDLGVTVSAEDVVEFLLVDQYVIGEDQTTRVDALETLGRTAITRMLESSLPSPVDLAERFAPLVDERRLLLWTRPLDEQEFLDDVGLLGGLPEISAADGGFALAVTNASGNKIDSFLVRDVVVSEETDASGTRRLVADVTLTNNAPDSGLPPYVIGNEVGLPAGTNRMLVTLYGPPGVEAVTRDGAPIGVERFVEDGWFGHRSAVDIRSGHTVTYQAVFTLDGAGSGAFEPTQWEQPLRR